MPLSHNIYVITNLFITNNNYLFVMIRKIIFTNYFSEFIHQVAIKLSRRPATGLCGVRLLHDNASSHKATIVREYLKQEKVVELPHPPYSPDLAPCDSRLKNTSLEENIKREKIIPRKDYENAFKNWIKRLKLCLSHSGEYFEGLR